MLVRLLTSWVKLLSVTKPFNPMAISSINTVDFITLFTLHFTSAVRINFRRVSLFFSTAADEEIN